MTWKSRLFSILVAVFGDTTTFTLQEVYQTCEGVMSYYYPKSNTVQASIRLNLEKLRDDGIINFVDDMGTYSWVKD